MEMRGERLSVDVPVRAGWHIESVMIENGKTARVTFPANIRRAFAFIAGFSLSYLSGGERRPLTIAVHASIVAVKSAVVDVRAVCETDDDDANLIGACLPVVVIGVE